MVVIVVGGPADSMVNVAAELEVEPPMPVAMAMASLAELAPDRMGLCVSVGKLLNLAESGWTGWGNQADDSYVPAWATYANHSQAARLPAE